MQVIRKSFLCNVQNYVKKKGQMVSDTKRTNKFKKSSIYKRARLPFQFTFSTWHESVCIPFPEPQLFAKFTSF